MSKNGSQQIDLKFERLCDVAVDYTQQLVRNALAGRMERPYYYKPNKSDFGSLKKFQDWYRTRYKRDILESSLIEYMNKQFEWFVYRDQFADRRLDQFRLNWMFGAKSIKRWEEGLAEKRQFSTSDFKTNISLLDKQFKVGLNLCDVNEVEEKEKKRFLNTPAGLDWCIENTFLLNSKSPTCATCKFQKQCAIELKTIYPKIYKLRNNQ